MYPSAIYCTNVSGSHLSSLNLGENSWQRNREICVGCGEESETLEHLPRVWHTALHEVGREANRKQAGPCTDTELISLANSCSEDTKSTRKEECLC